MEAILASPVAFDISARTPAACSLYSNASAPNSVNSGTAIMPLL